MNAAPDDDVGYYAEAGPTTDIARHGDRIAQLSSDHSALGDIVRGILLHDRTAELEGTEISSDRDGMKIFGAGPILDRVLALDPAPLHEARAEEQRLVGFCYHFALLQCGFLRAKGVPSRARCGFANYLIPGSWTDHWVVEHWAGGGWRLSDPQIGLDVLSPNDFRDGVRAWQLCRAGEADAAVHGNGELWGWDELRGSLVNDIGALNKLEIGDWDWCELLRVEPLDQPHLQLDAQLDAIADMASPGRALDDLRAEFAANPAIRPPTGLGDQIMRD